jgi:hypothetical protein
VRVVVAVCDLLFVMLSVRLCVGVTEGVSVELRVGVRVRDMVGVEVRVCDIVRVGVLLLLKILLRVEVGV